MIYQAHSRVRLNSCDSTPRVNRTVGNWFAKTWGDGMTEQKLATIEARANAATLGPWEVGDPYNHRSPELLAVYGAGMEVADTQLVHDAAFIAASRTDIPALVAEVRRLRELVHSAWEEAYDAGQRRSSEWDAKVWLSSDTRKALVDG